jgi:phosphoribosylaminoimidazolecarboxamide formyltransferase/IMP cyclohydrolase
MATDVSSFKDAYKTAIKADFPKTVELSIGDKKTKYQAVNTQLRYGTNPHQPFAAYAPLDDNLSVGNLEMLKGGKAGLSLTNLQDMSQALNILKYFNERACVAMKHINPCGFKVQTYHLDTLAEVYDAARKCDERSHFGAVVGFNCDVNAETAVKIMETFVEGVIAPDYTPEALAVLNKNEGTKKLNNSIRVARASNMYKLPRYVGDDVGGNLNIRNLADGTLTFEIPYLTRIKSVDDFIIDPMIPNADPAKNNGHDYIVKTVPTKQQLEDCLTAWYLNINVRSNGIVFVKDGMALAVGTGQQERIGAVEQAIAKAKQKGHSLEGSVMSSDAFFPSRDCIDAVAKEGVKAVVWPAGSMADSLVIEAANEHNIALIATLERCFLHI